MKKTRQQKEAQRTASQVNPQSTAAPRISVQQTSAIHLPIWFYLGFIIAIGFVYSPSWSFGFVKFDDSQYVVENPYVVRGLTWEGISWAFTSGYAANWHPLTWMSHMLDVQMHGLRAGGHHFTNTLLHTATTIVLFVVLSHMTRAVGRSAVVAGLFAIHPIHVESVAWVAERKDVLSTFFWILTIWSYLAYVSKPQPRRYLLAVGLFALALMAKPMVVTLPFLLLLLDIWPLRRVSIAPGQNAVAARLVKEKAPLFGLALASSIITYAVQNRGGTVAVEGAIPFAMRFANALVSYVAYIGKTLWPTHLAAYYPYALSFPSWIVIACALGLSTVTVLAIWKAREYPYFLVGWLWYLGTLVPAIGFIQVGTQSMADRYTYVPMIGLSIVIVWGVCDIASRWKPDKAVLPAAAIVMLLACAALARAQVRTWESSTSLWEHALAVTDGNYAAHTYMGNALASQGKINEAIAHYNEALKIRPNYAEAHNNLGPALATQGKADEAIAHFSAALQIRPNYADAHNNLGVALAGQGRLPEAINHFSEAVRLEPTHPNAHYGLALALQRQGRNDGAIREFTETLRLNPNNQAALQALNALMPRRP